ncbi:hypothetical protein M0802_012366 [Mischocyttarus mexicanus]|nr:hypothetical protein M0802_012366 [Mischocyttarus mexicanus]
MVDDNCGVLKRRLSRYTLIENEKPFRVWDDGLRSCSCKSPFGSWLKRDRDRDRDDDYDDCYDGLTGFYVRTEQRTMRRHSPIRKKEQGEKAKHSNKRPRKIARYTT